MLRRDMVGHCNGLVKVIDHDNTSLALEGMAYGFGTRVAGNLHVQLSFHRVDQRLGVGHQDG